VPVFSLPTPRRRATLRLVAKTKAKLDWRMLLLLPIPLLWALAGHLGYLRVAEDLTLSWRYRFRGEIDAPVNVVYVDIDSQSISDLKNFPWPRSYFSQVGAALLNEGKAKVVGVDVVFSEKGMSPAYDAKRWRESNIEFYRYLRANPPMVFAASYSAAEYREANNKIEVRELPLIKKGLPPIEKIAPPEILEFELRPNILWSPPRLGLIDTLNGGTQWVALFAPTSTNAVQRFDHMALALALLYWDVPPEEVKITADAIEVPRADGSLRARIPLTDQQIVEVNWFSRWYSDKNPRISFSVVLGYAGLLAEGDDAQKQQAREFFAQFKDAVVLIGPVDPLLQDLAATPFDDVPVPKVGVHGNLLKTLVSGQYLHRLPPWALYAVTAVLAAAVTALSVLGGARGLWSKAGAVVLLGAYVGLGFLLFETSHVVLPLAAPLSGAFTMAFAGIAWQLVVEEKQKGRIKGMFSAYLAPTVVNSLIESGKEPELGGHEETITAYFSDIQSFSTFSEKMTPARLVELMNEYLTACTDIVQEEGGTLDKYIGDAVVAMFGAPLPLPDHAYRACVASVRVQKKIEELRQKWRGEGEKWPPVVHNLRARLGLNSGPAIIGNMGSRTRFSYTMMGDNVNLAARMESGAKLMGVYTMVTDTTRAECEKHGGDRIVFRFLDKIVVKGRSLPVGVHEIVGLKEDVSAETHLCLALHAQGVERYHAQDWAGAIDFFERSAKLELHQPSKSLAIESNPSLIMIERCAYMREHPPGANWDGVFVMKEKG
jgi:adenylate cyclase